MNFFQDISGALKANEIFTARDLTDIAKKGLSNITLLNMICTPRSNGSSDGDVIMDVILTMLQELWRLWCHQVKKLKNKEGFLRHCWTFSRHCGVDLLRREKIVFNLWSCIRDYTSFKAVAMVTNNHIMFVYDFLTVFKICCQACSFLCTMRLSKLPLLLTL